jgi:hypothetical protein
MSKFASLTAGLLARKGEAEPTSTPFAEQLLTRVGAPAADIRALTPMPHPHVHTHAEPGVVKQTGLKQVPAAVKPVDSLTSIFGAFGRREAAEAARQELEPFRPTLVPSVPSEGGAADNCAVCTGPSAEELAKTFHVNLRLKRQRFVKLKLSAALLRRPVQDIVADALDNWFDKLPPDVLGDCACMKTRGD